MLDIDASAVRALSDLQRSAGVIDHGGLRITLADRREQSRFTLTVVPRATEGDEVVAAGDARVFLTPPAAGELRGKVLHANVDVDGTVRFGVRSQR